MKEDEYLQHKLICDYQDFNASNNNIRCTSNVFPK